MAQIYNNQLDAFDLYHQFIEEQRGTKSFVGEGPDLPPIGHACTGAAGSALSNVIVYPLDLIITRLQIQRNLRKSSTSANQTEYKSVRDAAQKIYEREGGLKGLYAGCAQDTAKTVADSFLFFLAYNTARETALNRHNGKKSLPVFEELGVGFVAGAFSKLLTTPIANVVTRLQTSTMVNDEWDEKPTARSIAKQIHTEKGVQGFWSGYSASLVLTLNPSLTFFFFETFKRLTLPRSRRDNPPPSATFFLSACSKALASAITYPFSLAKARSQVSSKSDEGEKGSSNRAAKATVFAMIMEIARTEGIAGLYDGLSGEVLKGFFNHGITMIIKDMIQKLVIQLYYMGLKLLRKYPNPEEMAAIAKARAQKALTRAQNNAQTALASAQDNAQKLGHQTAETAEKIVEKGKEVVDKGKEAVGQGGK